MSRIPPARIIDNVFLPWVIGLIIACLSAVVAFNVDQLEQNRMHQLLRGEALAKLSHIRAELEGHLNSDLQLFNGLVTQISLHPEITADEIELFTRTLFEKSSIVRSIGVSEKYIIRHVYPFTGNEKAIGLNYLDNVVQREPVLRAVKSRQAVLAGPISLAQGGNALIGRLPIFTVEATEQLSVNAFWGVVSVVIDIDLLFEKVGLLASDNNMKIAIRGRDGLGDIGDSFFGEDDIFNHDPILLDIRLPGGRWQLAAMIGNGGQHDLTRLHIILRIMGTVLVILLSLAAVVTTRQLQQQRKIIAVEQQSKEQIWHAATHDRLTGLANRYLFNEELQHYISQAKRSNTSLAVLFCDLDGFKEINDSFGHQVGDQFLKAVSERLTDKVRQSELIARLGGDEFAILNSPLKNAEEAANLAQRVRDLISQPIEIGRNKLHCDTSIGIAIYPEDGETPDQLLHNADLAMYRAKQDLNCSYAFFEESMNEEVQEQKKLVEDIRQGMPKGQFSLLYQPVIDLYSGRVIGVEALSRWHHPERGVVSPGIFIPAAEKSGLIIPFGEWVLENACAETSPLHEKPTANIELSVNFSAIQIHRADPLALAHSVIDQHGIPAHALDIEITESAILEDVDRATRVVNELRDAGISVTIDDFGTGYSSLSHLRYLPVNRIKLDISFVRGIGRDAYCESIIRAIMFLSNMLDIRLTAEGVETIEQLEFLKQHGCTEIQGYYFSKPLDKNSIVEFIDKFDLNSFP